MKTYVSTPDNQAAFYMIPSTCVGLTAFGAESSSWYITEEEEVGRTRKQLCPTCQHKLFGSVRHCRGTGLRYVKEK